MSKRISPESIAVRYFETAPLETAQAVLSICQSKMKERVRESQPAQPARTRAKRKAKTNTNAHGSATSFPGSEVQASA